MARAERRRTRPANSPGSSDGPGPFHPLVGWYRVIANFPQLQLGELVSSAIARYCDAFDITNMADVSRLIFGGRVLQRTTIVLPSSLAILADRLGHDDCGILLDGHTLFPYHAAFLAPAHRTKIRNAALAGDMDAGRLLGFARYAARRPSYLRFCRRCLETDRLGLGFGYWHREHQLPGVLVCAVHPEPLEWSEEPVSGGRGLLSPALQRRPVASLEFALAVSSSSKSTLPVERSDALAGLARASAFLVDTFPTIPSERDLALDFRQMLHKSGTIVSRSVRGQQSRLLEDARRVWGDDVLRSLERWGDPGGFDDSDVRHSTDALVSLFTHLGSARRTLPYLLLLPVVGATIEKLLGKADAETAPSTLAGDHSPMPDPDRDRAACINPSCPHGTIPPKRQAFTEDTPKISHRCAHCGFTYAIVNVRSFKAYRVAQTGPLWDAELKRLLASRDTTIEQFVASLGRDYDFIKIRALDIGRWHCRWSEGSKRTIQARLYRWRQKPAFVERSYDPGVVSAERKEWDDLRRELPDADGISLLRRARRTYAYLRLHDAEWLDRNLPAFANAIGGVASADLPARDAARAGEAARAIKTIRRLRTKPRRLTKYAIAEVMRQPHAARSFKGFPLTEACFAAALEEDDTWMKRKIRWYADHLAEKVGFVSPHMMQVSAGLTKAKYAKYRSFIDEVLAEAPCRGDADAA